MISRFNAQYSEGALRLRFWTSAETPTEKKPDFRFRCAYVEAVDAAVFKVDVFVVADGEEKASVGVTGFAGHTHYLFDDNGIIIIYQGIV